MKFTDFIKKYPNYIRFRFSDEDGEVRFLFNGDYYDPFDPNGNLVKTLYEFPSWNGHTYEPENIHDFLTNLSSYKINYAKTYKPWRWNQTPLKYKEWSTFDIYVTPDHKTPFKFRDIFNSSELIFKTAKEAERWLSSPNLSYFSQALNFAVWCATGGCGVTRNMLSNDQVGSFYKFHVYFTIRRVLNELQCPLPGDKQYSWNNNFYNKASFQRLQKEFNNKTNDFRFRSISGHGLGDTYYWGYGGLSKDPEQYVPYHSIDQLSDEWSKAKSHQGHFEVAYVTDAKTKFQYEWFFPRESQGLTKAGLSRMNQSIEAFVYCLLGSQAKTRSTIVGEDGSAQETKRVFLQLFESSVMENDVSKSIQRYQFALTQAKQRLDLVVAYGCWLLPRK